LARLASDQQRVWRWNWKWVAAFAAACVVIALLVAPHEKRGLIEVGTKAPDGSITGTSSTAASTGAGEVRPKRNLASSLPPRELSSRKHTQPRVLQLRSGQAINPVPHDDQQTHSAVAVVKQPVFPAPSPLSEQEKLLFAYLRRTPYQELVQNSKPDEPKVENEINQVTPEQEKSLNKNSNSR